MSRKHSDLRMMHGNLLTSAGCHGCMPCPAQCTRIHGGIPCQNAVTERKMGHNKWHTAKQPPGRLGPGEAALTCQALRAVCSQVGWQAGALHGRLELAPPSARLVVGQGGQGSCWHLLQR